jgi:hypothetical protein
MHGVSKYYETGEVDLLALLAGNDILLFSQDVGKAIEYIKNAVDKRKITEKEITARVKKVMQLKKWMGLDNFEPLPTKNLVSNLNSENAKLVRRRLVENAMTLLHNKENILPVKGLSKLRLASVSIGVDDVSPFQKMLENYAPVDHFYISSNPTKEEVIKIISDLKDYNLTVVGIHGNSRSPGKKFGLTQNMMDVLNNIKSVHPTIVSVFANPYSLGMFPQIGEGNALIMAYENTLLSQEYAAQLIFGGINAKGKLPITASERFKVGDGLVTKKKTFKIFYSD